MLQLPHNGTVPRKRIARQRICLLKGCESDFKPVHPLSRYCSASCRQEARRWSQQRANQRYRSSTQGKDQRSRQASRYRERIKSRTISPAPTTNQVAEGYHKADLEKMPCQRPGCYLRFLKSARSPEQKFCNSDCRQAMRRVLVRERRWGVWSSGDCASQLLFDDW